jgi:hypothetical protein
MLLKAIENHCIRIKNKCDKEDFRQEVFAELYDFMPIDEEESLRLINKVSLRFRREVNKIAEHEVSYQEAGIV